MNENAVRLYGYNDEQKVIKTAITGTDNLYFIYG